MVLAVKLRRSPAEELRALAEAARAGDLDSEGQARLERLLLSTWRRRLGLAEVPHAEALRRLREHAEAGALLGQLEAWLHMPHPPQEIDLQSLLEPYRHVAASSIGPATGGSA